MDITGPFSLVWLKRDLRLRDHQPLQQAIAAGQPIVIAFIIEPELLIDEHMDIRHWRFIYQSLVDMNEQLQTYNGHISLFKGEACEVFSQLRTQGMNAIYSHQEIGLQASYKRDIRVNEWCKKNHVNWHEAPYGAVKRPMNNRFSWRKHWFERMSQDIFHPHFSQAKFYRSEHALCPIEHHVQADWLEQPRTFQLGGEKRAWFTLKHFFEERGQAYFGNIGNPTIARKSCSRLSPYLAWGNISIRQVVQYTQSLPKRKGWVRSIEAFSSRLSWRCHFIQKFESEHEMQYRPVNTAYANFEYANDKQSQQHLEAWEQGKTGIPIIDASMRALHATGYINFRMRAMLVSFLTHHLNIDWRRGVVHLGKLFLDFEPGIHYPQFQMQAGITGTNIIRIYNPIKQGIDKDPDGEFVRKWLPELADIPKEFIHEPALLPPIDAAMIDFDIQRDYVLPIVDMADAARSARERLWAYRERDDVKKEAKRILVKPSVLN